jgi:hypothetical protein
MAGIKSASCPVVNPLEFRLQEAAFKPVAADVRRLTSCSCTCDRGFIWQLPGKPGSGVRPAALSLLLLILLPILLLPGND